MGSYKQRCIEPYIEDNLEAFGAVLIVGPKWCGKTTIARRFAKTVVELANPQELRRYEEIADIDVSLLFRGEKPILFDEWQVIPELWDTIRYDVDKTGKFGEYILTGSTTVERSEIRHSGAGRITTLKMTTMSLFESGDSNGEISLRQLFSGAVDSTSESTHTIQVIAKLITRGGWPATIDVKESTARLQLEGYCRTILQEQITTPDGKSRDPARMGQILRSLARNESTEAANTAILADVTSGGAHQMHINTLVDYIRTLESIYVVDELPAWCPKLRSKTVVRTSSIRHFSDPAIGAFFLNASANDLLRDPETFGMYFESLVIRDLRAYATPLGGQVLHYRDKSGLEADAIIHLSDGRWAAFEVRLGRGAIDSAAKHLLKLKERVDSEQEGDPAFLAVVTYTGFAYRRNDGVFVIPIGCLGP